MSESAAPGLNTLPLLLTVESFLFAAFGIALAIMGSTALAHRSKAEGRMLAVASAGLLSVVAVGAAFAWYRTFADQWPDRLDEQVPAIAIAIGVVAQPVIAWYVAWLVARRPRATADERR